MTAAVGSLSVALDVFRTTIADAAAFRTWAGAGDQAAALARIYRTALPPPGASETYSLAELQVLRPFVIIWTEGYENDHDAVSSAFSYGESGSFRMRFEQDIAAEIADDPAEIQLQVENSIGQILDDMAALAGTAGYTAITKWAWDGDLERARREDVNTQGDWVVVEVVVQFGGL